MTTLVDRTMDVLLVEDNPGDRDLIAFYLEVPPGVYRLSTAGSLAESYTELRRGSPDVVLLDLGLPDSTGIATFRALHTRIPDVPIVVITGLDNDLVGIEALGGGAQDYLIKGRTPSGTLTRSLRYAIERHRLLRQIAWERVEREHYFDTIVERAPDGILIVDGRGCIQYANPKAVHLLGGTPQTTIGSDFGRPVRAGSVSEVGITRADGTPGRAEMRVHATEWRGVPAFLTILRDVTDSKRAVELQARLVHADRLAAIGQLAAGVAHEINNPLAYVIANLGVLESHATAMATVPDQVRAAMHDGFGPECVRLYDAVLAAHGVPQLLADCREMIGETVEGAERIRRAAKDLRSFSRIEHDEVELVNANDVINTACNIVHNEIRHRARLVKDLAPLPMIVADRGKLIQVMTNLIVNAAQSIDSGAADDNRVMIATASSDGAIRIVVEDTGCGIPAQNLRRIFEPFFTTKPGETGTGLGLSLSAEIIRNHGGDITVTSHVGQGSRFEVVLPLENSLHVSRPPIPQPVRDADTDYARVLVMDDEQAILNVFRRTIGRRHDVVTAECGSKGLEILQEDTDFDVIVCDLMMPNIDGVMLYERLQEVAPHLVERIVFCSGGAFTARAQEFLASVPNVVLEKPVDFEILDRFIALHATHSRGETRP